MNHSRQQVSLIRTLEPDTQVVSDHVVKRQQVSKWIRSFRDAGFIVTYVQHDYHG